MKRNYPYLNDSEFLLLADTQRIQNQYIKLTLLNWAEEPLAEVQGFATGGSLSINGSSAIRRTCNVTMTVKNVSTGQITDAKNLISINKKIYVEIGIENKTPYYRDYPILWYPQGTMVVTQCSVATDVSNGTTLSAQLKDKMCLLNGECGGVITSAVNFHEYDTLDETTGKMVTIKPTITQIIRELVNHFGGEQLGKILISDIEEEVKMAMRWTGSNPAYLVVKGDKDYLLTTSEEEAKSIIAETGGTIQEFHYGKDIGFEYTKFTWPEKELTANAGDNVCTILEKIKNYLGNYEYYYDIDGNFIFQEIKNYLNTTQATVDLKRMNNNDYKIDIAKGKSVYDFSDNKLLTSLSHSPQYNRIKNDYIVWGIRENAQGNKLPIRYHLAIDKKPDIGKIYEVFFYTDPDDGLRKAKCPVKYKNRVSFPEIGAEGVFYLDMNTNIIYKWDGDKMTYVSLVGTQFQEYNDPSKFPSPGQTGVIYISTSDSTMYDWEIVPGSNHYREVTNDITALTISYNNDMASYQAQIKAAESWINYYQGEIDEAKKPYQKWFTQKQIYDRQLEELNSQKESLQDEINENQAEKLYYDNIVAEKQNEINNINSEINNPATPPARKAELQALLPIVQEERDNAQAESNLRTNNIIRLRAELAPINTSIQETEELLIPVNEALEPFYEDIELYEYIIEELNDRIAQNEEDIEILTNHYNEQKSNLEATLGEYVRYYGEKMTLVKATDWRSELYLSGAAAEPLGLTSNYYYPELNAEWPKLYNLQADYYIDEDTQQLVYTGAFYDNVLENPDEVDYWLDFIDSTSSIDEFNVSNIGRRSVVENKDDYNCVFEDEIPDIVIINTKDEEETSRQREECEKRNQDYIQVEPNIYDALVIGGTHNSCFNEIKNLLWEDTNYNASISISGIPVYHLEPNTRITINSNSADIHGDFIIQSLSIPLTMNGTMSISATQVQEKL